MDSMTNTELLPAEINLVQENLLLNIIKETCSNANCPLSPKLRGKINRIIADCDLSHYSGLHKLSTADENTSTLLGFMNQTAVELSFDEQVEFNQAIIEKIQIKIPQLIKELNNVTNAYDNTSGAKTNKQDQLLELQQSLDDKINTLDEQEKEKIELMMQWLNHRHQDVINYNENTVEHFSLKTQILELKSKVLHLQILHNIFTETNQSIKAYSEIHKELKQSLMDTEQRIKEYNEIIHSQKS